MNSDAIKHWLMLTPRPAYVQVTDHDGTLHEVTCGQTTWVRTAETIGTLRPELLQAMTAEKQIIRALRPADVNEDWTPEDDQPTARARRAAQPQIQIPLANLDPESARFVLFGQLLAQAYQHSTDVAFGRLSEIIEAQNRRAEGVERTREAMYREHVKQLERALKEAGRELPEPPNGDLLQSMLGGLLEGLVMGKGGGGGPVANGKDHTQ